MNKPYIKALRMSKMWKTEVNRNTIQFSCTIPITTKYKPSTRSYNKMITIVSIIPWWLYLNIIINRSSTIYKMLLLIIQWTLIVMNFSIKTIEKKFVDREQLLYRHKFLFIFCIYFQKCFVRICLARTSSTHIGQINTEYQNLMNELFHSPWDLLKKRQVCLICLHLSE